MPNFEFPEDQLKEIKLKIIEALDGVPISQAEFVVEDAMRTIKFGQTVDVKNPRLLELIEAVRAFSD